MYGCRKTTGRELLKDVRVLPAVRAEEHVAECWRPCIYVTQFAYKGGNRHAVQAPVWA